MHFELAADRLSVATPDADRSARFICLRKAARALANLNQYQQADRLLSAAEELASPGAEYLELLHVRIPCWLMINEVQRARAGLEALIDSLETPPSDLPATTQDSTWNCILCFGGYTHRALRLLNLAPGHGRADGICSGQELAARGSLSRLIDDHSRAVALIAPIVREALAEARGLTLALNAAVIWVRSSLALGDMYSADQALMAMTELHRQMGNGLMFHLEVSWHRAMRVLAAGEPESALDSLRTMRAQLVEAGLDQRVNIDHYSMLEATCLAALGDYRRAFEIVAQLSAAVRTQDLGPDPRQMWVSKLGAHLAVKLNLDVWSWLDRLAVADCNRSGDAMSLDAECIFAVCGEVSPITAWERAQRCGRLPLGHVLGAVIPSNTPRDPWLYPL